MCDATWRLANVSARIRMLARFFLLLGLAFCANYTAQVLAADGKWPMVGRVERQPLTAATERLVQALDFVGSPLDADTRKKLDEALKLTDEADATTAIQRLLDPR